MGGGGRAARRPAGGERAGRPGGRRVRKAADPRDAIANWSAETPLLLLPVRLETRFKTVTDEAGAHDELWVRIYPDACSVDTFEAALSDTELASARRYWIETWAAGGIEAQHRAAWRNLVASHGAGRAAWIVRESAPAGAPPVKADPADVLLVIAIDAPPGADEQAALSAFWTAAWVAERRRDPARPRAPGARRRPRRHRRRRADRDVRAGQPRRRARAAGDARRRRRRRRLARAAAGAEAKTRSWTAPARVDTLPDRFVVVGYQDDRVVFEAEGRPIPSPLIAGPDPSAPADEQLGHDADGALKLPEPVRWMVDFEAAVAVGMGVKVRDLGATDLTRPLQRVIAIGLRLADDATQGQARLEKLLEHHRFGSAGLALVPQGTPTNNTDEAAGHDRRDDADAAYDALFGAGDALPATAGDWWGRRDGEWLADGLGIGVATLDGVPHAGGTDLARRARSTARSGPRRSATALETHAAPGARRGSGRRDPLVPDALRARPRDAAEPAHRRPAVRRPAGQRDLAVGLAGRRRAARVGGLRTPDSFIGYRAGLAGVLATMREDWRLLAQEVSFVGKAGDPHQLLLDVVGLHPGSVEFHQRYAESLEDLFNRAKLQGRRAGGRRDPGQPPTGGGARAARPAGLRGRGGARRALEVLLHAREPAERPAGRRPAAVGDRADPRLHARRARLPRVARRRRARRFEDLRQERGFAGRPPAALLYLLLRHALLLGYWDGGLRLHLEAGRVDAQEVRTARREQPFVHVAAERGGCESRYAPLYSTDGRVTAGHASVAERIGAQLADAASTRGSPTSSRRSSGSRACRRRGSSAASPSTSTSPATGSTRGCSGSSTTSSPQMRYRPRERGDGAHRGPPRRVRLARGPAAQAGAAAGRRARRRARRRVRRRRRGAAARPAPTAATCTRRRSTTRRPPRCCAPATSPTRRRRSRARWRSTSRPSACASRSASSRASATARRSARCSATGSSAACTTGTRRLRSTASSTPLRSAFPLVADQLASTPRTAEGVAIEAIEAAT